MKALWPELLIFDEVLQDTKVKSRSLLKIRRKSNKNELKWPPILLKRCLQRPEERNGKYEKRIFCKQNNISKRTWENCFFPEMDKSTSSIEKINYWMTN